MLMQSGVAGVKIQTRFRPLLKIVVKLNAGRIRSPVSLKIIHIKD